MTLVMAFCIGLWLRDTSLKLRQQGIELNKKALSHFKKQVQLYIQATKITPIMDGLEQWPR
jgi:hypothetical protein